MDVSRRSDKRSTIKRKSRMTSDRIFVGKIFNGGNMGSSTRINELIDNERLHRSQSMTMTMSMNRYGVRDEKLDESNVDQQAECLVSMFGAPGSKPLYCDAVRYLTKAYLDEQVKVAMEKGKVPAKLFGYIIYKKLRSLGLYANN